MSVYTCLFASESLPEGGLRYSAIVGTKKFIQTRDQGDNGTIINFFPPQIILNNPGQKVFPGGRAKSGEAPIDGALREFGEETGIVFSVSGTARVTNPDYPGSLPFHLDTVSDASGTTLYSCVYIKARGDADLNYFQGKIQGNISSRTTPSDELQQVERINLKSYSPYVPTAACTAYCTANSAALRVPSDRVTWIAALTPGTGTVPIQPPDPTTEPDAPSKTDVIGVEEFNYYRYDMGPFMRFMIDPTSPLFTFPADSSGNRLYSFFGQNETGIYPSRFSTDWFSSISERIPAINLLFNE